MKNYVLAGTMLLLAGCTIANPPPPDTAQLPAGGFGLSVNGEVSLIDFDRYDWAAASRTAGQPAEGARAVGGLDYLAGALNTSPRWVFISAITKLQLLQARRDVRHALGIAPDAPSQLIVDRMNDVFNALSGTNGQGQNRRAALTALSDPAFTLGPDATLDRLTHLPFVQMANVATTRAAAEKFGPGSGGGDVR